MKRDKRIQLLLVPVIIMVIIHIPAMILTISEENMNINIYATPNIIKVPFIAMQSISMLIWATFFYYISIKIYTVLALLYTCVSWTYILRQKKGSVVYFAIWVILYLISILLYWKFAPEYHSMLNG